MSTNFELKRLKPELGIVKKPENRVHKLTDSNGAQSERLRGPGVNSILITFLCFLKPFLKGKILRSSERGVSLILTIIFRF